MRFDWLLYVFGVILLIVALKTTFGKDDDNKENGIAKFMRNRFDYVDTEETRGKLFAKVNGKRVVTVLLLCVIVIEMTDIVFALDSLSCCSCRSSSWPTRSSRYPSCCPWSSSSWCSSSPSRHPFSRTSPMRRRPRCNRQ